MRAPRQALPSDLPAVQRIVDRAYTPYIAAIGQRPGPLDDDYAALIKAGHAYVLDASPSEPARAPVDTLSGLVVLVPTSDGLLLDNIAVDPSAAGHGIGRVLAAFAERAARDAGFTAIRLYTNELMRDNIAWYTRLGYVETERKVERGLRRVYMAKALCARPGNAAWLTAKWATA